VGVEASLNLAMNERFAKKKRAEARFFI